MRRKGETEVQQRHLGSESTTTVQAPSSLQSLQPSPAGPFLLQNAFPRHNAASITPNQPNEVHGASLTYETAAMRAPGLLVPLRGHGAF